MSEAPDYGEKLDRIARLLNKILAAVRALVILTLLLMLYMCGR